MANVSYKTSVNLRSQCTTPESASVQQPLRFATWTSSVAMGDAIPTFVRMARIIVMPIGMFTTRIVLWFVLLNSVNTCVLKIIAKMSPLYSTFLLRSNSLECNRINGKRSVIVKCFKNIPRNQNRMTDKKDSQIMDSCPILLLYQRNAVIWRDKDDYR